MNEGLKALMQRKNVDTLIPETEHAGRTAEEDDWTGLDWTHGATGAAG